MVKPQGIPATRKDGKTITLMPQGKNIVMGKDMGVYGTNAFWPTVPASVTQVGKMRKYQMTDITVPLAIFNPVTGALSKLSQINIRVSFDRAPMTSKMAAEAAQSDSVGLERAKKWR